MPAPATSQQEMKNGEQSPNHRDASDGRRLRGCSRHAPVGRLGRWRLTSLADAAAFVSGWRQVAEWALATQPLGACPIVLRDENDPHVFDGWWPFETLEGYRIFRNSPGAQGRFCPTREDAGAHR
jgi:hypothetical protein